MENNLTPEDVVAKISQDVTDKLKSVATLDEVNAIKGDLEALKGLEAKSLNVEKSISKLEGKLEALTEKAQNEPQAKANTLGDIIIKGMANDIDAIKAGQSFTLDTKADTTITGDYTGTIALSVLDPEVNHIARQKILIQNEVSRGTTSSKFVTYIQQTLAPTSTFILEAGEKNEGEAKYTEVSKEVKKVAGLIKISKEMLEDLPFMRSEINSELVSDVTEKIENGILNGTGVGVQLDGMYTNATAFVAGGFALQVIDANLSDVIRVACAQVEANKFVPTHVILHPRDVARMHLTKATDGTYTYPVFYMNPLTGQQMVFNLKIISTTFMTEGNFLVGDLKRDFMKMREGVNIQVGYVNDDFKRNMVSILAEARLVNYIKANDTGAFVKGVIATAITAIDKP